jgi:hypothetical protein
MVGGWLHENFMDSSRRSAKIAKLQEWDHTMRQVIWGLLLAGCSVSLTGCGGCGALDESDLRRLSRKRLPDELDNPPPPPIAATPAAAPADQANPPQSGLVLANTNAPSTQNAPAANPIAKPAPTEAQPMPTALPPTSPVQVVVNNARPPRPLTADEARQHSIGNLRKLGQALVAHAERTGSLPAIIRGEQGKPLLSWRVALLPELGHGELYRQFRLTEAWDSPHNKQLLAQIPPELQSPERFDTKTNYLGLADSGQAFAAARGNSLGSMEDGPENTVVLIEAGDQRAVEWTAPIDFNLGADPPTSGMGRRRADGAFALLGDGRVVRLAPELPDHVLLALFSPDGGEQLVAADIVQEPAATPATVAAVPATDAVNPPVPMPAEAPGTPSPEEPAAVPPAPPSLVLGHSSDPPADSNLVPVPPEADLAKARELFRELFGKQYAEARTWEDKAKLAGVLMNEATKVEKNPAHYHELLRITRDVAVGGGDAATALEAARLLTQRFQVDRAALRLKLLEDFSKAPRKYEAAETLRKEALDLLLDAFDADKFDVALPAYERLVEFTRIKGDRGEVSRLTQRKQPLEAAKNAYQDACAAAQTLEANPNDAQASETLGKYLCFVKNRWQDGLPHLVRAAEVKLRIVARIDMESGRSAQDSLSLADQYWEMAGEYKQPFSRGLHLRAALCYQTALNSLPEGLERLKAQKRIDEAGDIYGKDVVARALAAGGGTPVAVSE